MKIAIEAKNSDKPIIVVKENSYMANRLREILVSYFEEDEFIEAVKGVIKANIDYIPDADSGGSLYLRPFM